PLPRFLYSQELTIHDLLDVLDELKIYVTRYDRQIVCGDIESKDELCKTVIHQLAIKYFEIAMNTSLLLQESAQRCCINPQLCDLVLDGIHCCAQFIIVPLPIII
ncbi:hypothetical protein MN116_001281, partial [Schistosoma mekongi]